MNAIGSHNLQQAMKFAKINHAVLSRQDPRRNILTKHKHLLSREWRQLLLGPGGRAATPRASHGI